MGLKYHQTLSFCGLAFWQCTVQLANAVVNRICPSKRLPSHLCLTSHVRPPLNLCNLKSSLRFLLSSVAAISQSFKANEGCKCRRDLQVMFDVKMSDKRAATTFGNAESSLCSKACLKRGRRSPGASLVLVKAVISKTRSVLFCLTLRSKHTHFSKKS